jgi:hypothetical protein
MPLIFVAAALLLLKRVFEFPDWVSLLIIRPTSEPLLSYDLSLLAPTLWHMAVELVP